jgi:hypothetical protein
MTGRNAVRYPVRYGTSSVPDQKSSCSAVWESETGRYTALLFLADETRYGTASGTMASAFARRGGKAHATTGDGSEGRRPVSEGIEEVESRNEVMSSEEHGPGFSGEGVDKAGTDAVHHLARRRTSCSTRAAWPGPRAASFVPPLDTTLAAHPLYRPPARATPPFIGAAAPRLCRYPAPPVTRCSTCRMPLAASPLERLIEKRERAQMTIGPRERLRSNCKEKEERKKRRERKMEKRKRKIKKKKRNELSIFRNYYL